MVRKALGRGLDALIPDEAKAVLEGEVRFLALDRIRPNPFQPRQKPEENLSELVASIKEKGLLQPVVVRRRRDGYELVAGERRLRAAKLAGLKNLPAVIRDASESEMLELALVENIQRQDINPLEAALAFRRLCSEFGMTHDSIAQKVGMARSAITNSLRLLSLPQKVKGYLMEGKISSGHARALLSLPSSKLMEEVCERIVREGLSVRAIERLGQKRSKTTRSATRDSELVAWEERLGEILGTKVKIRRKGAVGVVLVEFYSDADLNRILSVITKKGRDA
jgi:ParB family chromosome partitioning protein